MSKKNIRRKSSYVLFERKMTRKMLSLVLISIGAVFLLRELIRGRFGDSVVAFLTGVFHLDYSDALYIYEATFRNNLDSIIAAAIIIALIIVFRYSIRWVTEYFDEISAGCDSLLDEKTELHNAVSGNELPGAEAERIQNHSGKKGTRRPGG